MITIEIIEIMLGVMFIFIILIFALLFKRIDLVIDYITIRIDILEAKMGESDDQKK